MKTKSALLLSILAFVLLIFSGCKKESTDSFTGCRLVSTSFNGGFSYIFYDNNGRPIRTERGTYLSTTTYSGNTVTILSFLSGAFNGKYIYTLNDAGLTVNIRSFADSLGTNWSNVAYEYNGDEVATQSYTSTTNSSYILTYAWQDGNIIQSVSSNTGLIAYYEYYLDKPVSIGDYYATAPLNGTGHVLRNKNLLKGMTYNAAWPNPMNITYEFDADGKITARTSQTASSTIRNEYQYECN